MVIGEMAEAFYRALVDIEYHTGASITGPNQVRGEELQIACQVAYALRTGRGFVTVSMLSADVPSQEVNTFIEQTGVGHRAPSTSSRS